LGESAALVLVSKEEGFGFPILEAFDFGLPVVASDIPVLREIGGEACEYVNPNSPEAIASGLEKIITDENLSSKLITTGHERLKFFGWSRTAEKILAEILNP
ncbi:MAG TPA: glycosyltransferase, partial [Patescibacteria group bacterium]|nr:glycosyltransferase [Patescibacteria group bacterium]